MKLRLKKQARFTREQKHEADDLIAEYLNDHIDTFFDEIAKTIEGDLTMPSTDHAVCMDKLGTAEVKLLVQSRLSLFGVEIHKLGRREAVK